MQKNGRYTHPKRDILINLLGIKKNEMSEEKIHEKVQLIDLYTKAPLVIGRPDGDHKANWIEYCIYHVRVIDRNLEMMMNMSAYLDSECYASDYYSLTGIDIKNFSVPEFNEAEEDELIAMEDRDEIEKFLGRYYR